MNPETLLKPLIDQLHPSNSNPPDHQLLEMCAFLEDLNGEIICLDPEDGYIEASLQDHMLWVSILLNPPQITWKQQM